MTPVLQITEILWKWDGKSLSHHVEVHGSGMGKWDVGWDEGLKGLERSVSSSVFGEITRHHCGRLEGLEIKREGLDRYTQVNLSKRFHQLFRVKASDIGYKFYQVRRFTMADQWKKKGSNLNHLYILHYCVQSQLKKGSTTHTTNIPLLYVMS